LPYNLAGVHNRRAMHAGQRARMLKNPALIKPAPKSCTETLCIGGDQRTPVSASRNHPCSR
jgi:hypothetical protein